MQLNGRLMIKWLTGFVANWIGGKRHSTSSVTPLHIPNEKSCRELAGYSNQKGCILYKAKKYLTRMADPQ